MPEQPKLTPTATPKAGGSAAGKAYREEMAQQGEPVGEAHAKMPVVSSPKPPSHGPIGDARAAKRKLIGGRVLVVRNGAHAVVGKMIDISETGACVMLEDVLASKVGCVLEFDIFHEGRRYAFSTQAHVVYGVLSSGKGFKVGFQFGPHSSEASKCLSVLVA